MAGEHGGAAHDAESESLELGLDILFVFTITQLAKSLAVNPSWGTLGHTVLLVVLLWWTFGSYASLSRAGSTARGRLLLAVGIVANFVVALAVPAATGADRLVFALAFTVLVGCHVILYLFELDEPTPADVRRIVLSRAVSPALVIVGALLGGPGLLVLWTLAAAAEVARSRLSEISGLPTSPPVSGSPDRFVQRHGVLLIIAIGESVLTIGIGLGVVLRDLDPEQIVVSFTALALAGTLYWSYFGEGADDTAHRRLSSAEPHHRETLALLAFGYAFAVMLVGIDLAVAGLHDVLEHPTEPTAAAYGGFLAGGVAAYWIGIGFFRLVFGMPFARLRIVGGLLLTALALLGEISGLVELVALLVGSLTILAIEQARIHRSRRAA